MKKFVVLMVLCLMTLSLVACDSNSSEAYEEFLKVNETMENAESVDMDMDMKATIEADGQSIDMDMKANMKQIMLSETDIQMEMNMDMELMGQKINSLSYFKDGYLYTSASGQKVKMAMDLEQLEQQANMGGTDFMFDEKAIKKSAIKEVGDNKEISFTLDGKAVTESISGMVESITSSLQIDPADMSFGDMEYTIVADKKSNLKSMIMKFDATITMQGQEMVIKYDITADINKINGVTITFPADLDTYQEVAM